MLKKRLILSAVLVLSSVGNIFADETAVKEKLADTARKQIQSEAARADMPAAIQEKLDQITNEWTSANIDSEKIYAQIFETSLKKIKAAAEPLKGLYIRDVLGNLEAREISLAHSGGKEVRWSLVGVEGEWQNVVLNGKSVRMMRYSKNKSLHIVVDDGENRESFNAYFNDDGAKVDINRGTIENIPVEALSCGYQDERRGCYLHGANADFISLMNRDSYEFKSYFYPELQSLFGDKLETVLHKDDSKKMNLVFRPH